MPICNNVYQKTGQKCIKQQHNSIRHCALDGTYWDDSSISQPAITNFKKQPYLMAGKIIIPHKPQKPPMRN